MAIALFEQFINIARFMEMWMFGRKCVSAWVCGCVGAWVRGCVGAWVRGCVGAWVRGCVGAWVRGCVGAWVRVSSYQVEVALHIYFYSLFHIPFNHSYLIHNCLLCKNPGNESSLVTKILKLNI